MTLPPPPPTGPIVSNPTLPQSAALASLSVNSASIASDSIVFVSLASGTAPEGYTAVVRNTTTGLSLTARMIDGGFDPVPLGARVGQTIQVVVKNASGIAIMSVQVAVVRSRPPVVVRTDPPHKKVEVPLNSTIVVVFSEPIDARTLSAGVRLFKGSTPIAGAVRLEPGGATAVFELSNALDPNAAYQLSVSQAVRDQDGESLTTPVTVEFTTGNTTVGSVASVTVSPDPATVPAGGGQIELIATVLDSAGNQLNGRSLTWTNSDTTVANIAYILSASVIVHGRVPGKTTITATSEAKSGATTVFVGDTGAISVVVTTTGVDLDPDGYTLGDFRIPINGTISFTAGIGTTSVDLSDVRINCPVDPPGPHRYPVEVRKGETTTVAFAVRCHAFRQIAFVREAYGQRNDIWLMNEDGTGQVRLTTDAAEDIYPAWSPDGSKLAFVSTRDGNAEIYVMNPDGSGQTRLTTTTTDEYRPSWSPDAAKIAYSDGASVYVMSADGSHPVRLAAGLDPAWSPDGTQIAFASDGIYVINVDGTGLRQLASDQAGYVLSPTWSPDGRKIAFVARDSIFTVGTDGAGRSPFGWVVPGHIAWSPDGDLIAFPNSSFGISASRPDGSGTFGLTVGALYDDMPAFRPIGIPPGTVSVVPALALVPIGDSAQLMAVVKDAAGNVLTGRSVIWSTSNVGVAQVSTTGLVRALAVGSATITAMSEGYGGTAIVLVPTPVATVTVAPVQGRVVVGGSVQLSAIMRDSAGIVLTGRRVTWTTSDPALATVSATGLVTGIGPGVATITATSEGQTGTAAITVEVIAFGSVTSGDEFSCGLASSGAAYCWGAGSYGQLGAGGSVLGSPTPVAVAGELTFTLLSAGPLHACGLTSFGAAYCWGDGIPVGNPSGNVFAPEPVPGGFTFVTLSAGATIYGHTCGLTANGAAYCWGYNAYGELGTGDWQESRSLPAAVVGGHAFTSVSSGDNYTCGITVEGDLYCWGIRGAPTVEQCDHGIGCNTRPVLVPGGLKFAMVTTGGGHTCGITPNGDAYCWGDNGWGQLGIGSSDISSHDTPEAVRGGHSFTTLTEGRLYTCGVITGGSAYCWGYNEYGQLGNGSTTGPDPCAGLYGSSLCSATPTAVSGGLTFGALSASSSRGVLGHTCGLTTSSVAYCWGTAGLGNPSLYSSTVPVKVTGQP